MEYEIRKITNNKQLKEFENILKDEDGIKETLILIANIKSKNGKNKASFYAKVGVIKDNNTSFGTLMSKLVNHFLEDK